MKIKDIMTKNVISVEEKTKITEVSSLLTKKRIHGMPVIKKNKVVGIITETDFFVKDLPDLYLPSYIDFLQKAEFKEKIDKKKKKEIDRILKATAKDIMTSTPITLSADDDVEKLANLIKLKNLYTVPVVDEKNQLVGIVTQADLLGLLGK